MKTEKEIIMTNSPSQQQYSSLLACYDNTLDRLNGILRDYQLTAVNSVKTAFLEGYFSPLLQSPTGSGKSVMILAVAVDALLKGENVGLIIHKEELLTQWMKHFEYWLPGFARGILGNKARYGALRDLNAPLQIMTIKTLHKLRQKPDLDLLIFDEAHHIPAMEWVAVLREYRSMGIKKVLGATATPIRLDGKGLDIVEFRESGYKEFVPAFDKLIPGPQTADLIEAGHLVPVDLFVGSHLANMDNAKIRMGEFASGEAEAIVKQDVPVDAVYREWFEIAGPDKLCIGYPVSVEYSKLLCDEFNLHIPGIARHVDANTPAGEREQIFADYEAGKFKVLFQHSIVIEGVDIPSVEVVLNIRPTASKAVWLQMLGRGLRPSPGKDKMILIDFTDNHQRLPMPSDHIEWSLQGASVHNFFDCPHCKKERRFFFLREHETEIERFKYYECSKCRNELEKKFEIKEKIKVEETIEKFTSSLTRKRLAKRHFDFKVLPDFYHFYERKAGDQSANLIDYIFCLHQYRLERNKKKPTKPFWGIFEIIRNFEREDLEPTKEMYSLIYQAFIDKESCEREDLEIPTVFDSLAMRKIYKATSSYKWAVNHQSAKVS